MVGCEMEMRPAFTLSLKQYTACLGSLGSEEGAEALEEPPPSLYYHI
jgi:hypothetical protein